MSPISPSKRGSALLIVLGLLSFLMISAVAFSIAMRTERSAAAAYRRNVLAREFLATTFADARATLDFALTTQKKNTAPAFDRDDFSTHTPEALAPFRYPSANNLYGRVISSRNTASSTMAATPSYSQDDEPIAYLLDDEVMRHLPPAIAYNVYATLELQDPVANASHLGYDNKYYVDWTAGWKPVVTSIPTVRANVGNVQTTLSTAVVGRMAWAVVNLSDMLDLNAVGSASTYRGIGLTANEFAYGAAPGASASGNARDRYDLLDATDTPASSELDLPVFLSNADLAWYAARENDNLIVSENGGVYPYSWESAVEHEGIGAFSPFTVYSFWPRQTRKKESNAGAASSADADGKPVVSCDELDAAALKNADSAVGAKVAALYEKTTAENNAAAQSFVRLLHDYLDADSEPNQLDSDGGTQDLFANAQPTVENVPMVCEVGYRTTDLGAEFVSKLKESLEKTLEGLTPGGQASEGYPSLDQIPSVLGEGKTLEIELPAPEMALDLRSYFPGHETADASSYNISLEGFVGVTGSAYRASGSGDRIAFEKATATLPLSNTDTGLSADGGTGSTLFSGGTDIPLSAGGGKLKFKLKGDQLPVANPRKSTPDDPAANKVTLAFLVDFFFRVQVEKNGTPVDLCPVDSGTAAKLAASDYPSTLDERWSEQKMGRLDSQFFRITRPVTVEFALEWDITEVKDGDGYAKGYKCETVVSDAVAINPVVEPNSPLTLEDGKEAAAATSSNEPSCHLLSPDEGTWAAIDPRYNWLSPMMGLSSGDASAYFGGAISVLAPFSSPHWVFQHQEPMTNGVSSASEAMRAYQNAHQGIVPFSWGLEVEDIRYGHNDTDQMLLPAEVGFLPVPMEPNLWNGGNASNMRTYRRQTISDYHSKVAQRSFFRTLPVVDFNDGALSETEYRRCTNVASMFQGFSGDNFPEEHRGLVNVFAGQDDYVLCQRLRQLALLGIPPTIKQAAKVTYDRLKAAETAKRISPKVITDLSAISSLTVDKLEAPKYDDFIRDYLFPLPSTSSGVGANASDWSRDQTLYKGVTGTPARPKNLRDFIVQSAGSGANTAFSDRLKAYNNQVAENKRLGQNDMTTLVASAQECFGDRQQLFLFILRADSIAYNSGRSLARHRPLVTSRAVALVWRDAYGELPDRVIYYQLLP